MTEVDANTIIITERLRLQPVSEKFKQVICKEFTAAITRYMPFSPSGDIKDPEAFIADANQQFTDMQSMHLCILEKESSEFLGMCGLHHINTTAIEIGLWLKLSAQQMGYGTETVKALVAFAEKKFAAESLIYPVDKNNIPSRKIPEKIGFVVFSKYQKKKDDTTTLDIVEYRKSVG
jgi:[ribosomal protein S5]-alanine N-acetyltransferase